MGKTKVTRESLTDQIKAILLERIIDGSLAPGDRLKELAIAKEFGTSQAPVREAIRSLQVLGHVEHKAHVGAFVKSFSKKEIEEAYQVREALEGHCLLLADMKLDSLARQLRLHLETMKLAMEAGDVKQFTEADNRFHQEIIECSNNQRMLETWNSLKIQYQVIATLAKTSIPLAELYRLHPPIVEAVEKGLRARSAKNLANHYREIGRYWQTHSHPHT